MNERLQETLDFMFNISEEEAITFTAGTVREQWEAATGKRPPATHVIRGLLKEAVEDGEIEEIDQDIFRYGAEPEQADDWVTLTPTRGKQVDHSDIYALRSANTGRVYFRVKDEIVPAGIYALQLRPRALRLVKSDNGFAFTARRNVRKGYVECRLNDRKSEAAAETLGLKKGDKWRGKLVTKTGDLITFEFEEE